MHTHSTGIRSTLRCPWRDIDTSVSSCLDTFCTRTIWFNKEATSGLCVFHKHNVGVNIRTLDGCDIHHLSEHFHLMKEVLLLKVAQLLVDYKINIEFFFGNSYLCDMVHNPKTSKKTSKPLNQKHLPHRICLHFLTDKSDYEGRSFWANCFACHVSGLGQLGYRWIRMRSSAHVNTWSWFKLIMLNRFFVAAIREIALQLHIRPDAVSSFKSLWQPSLVYTTKGFY